MNIDPSEKHSTQHHSVSRKQASKPVAKGEFLRPQSHISRPAIIAVVGMFAVASWFYTLSHASTDASASASPVIQEIIGNVPASNGYRYGARDNVGSTMDGAKIIANPSGGYLSVYHTGNTIKLATSTDILNWTFRVNLDTQASQATISSLPDGGFLTAAEYNDTIGSGGMLRLRYYPTLTALQAGNYSRQNTLARTLSACNEGTPNIYSATLTPDIDHSVIDIGFHYHKNCNVDRQARGTLTDFTSWSATAQVDLDTTLKNAATAVGQTVGGNIGDRDQMQYDGKLYNLHEVQYTKNDFSTWRTYLYDFGANTAAYLPIVTHGGSTAFANPTFTNLIAPSGNPAVVATMFIPSQGAANAEGGELIYYREYLPSSVAPVGLTATYYDNKDFTGSTAGKIEQINADWGAGAPVVGFGPDQFSARWAGRVLADKSETYTFYAQADDGVRLWVNGAMIINDWTASGLKERSGTITLAAGQQYDIKLEYYEESGNASARLLWSSPTTAKAVIPADHLFQTNRGLLARYFAGTAMTGVSKLRNDSNIDFNWGSGFGELGMGSDNFSVRWTGKITPAYSQSYTFYTQTDDGVRLWVNGSQIINDWTDRLLFATERKATISLVAGQQYTIKMDYYDKSGNASAKLLWSSPSVAKQIIPRDVLTPAFE